MGATVTRDRFWFTVIAIMSAVGLAAVAFVLTGPRLGTGLDVSGLPAINTAWNATAAVLLVAALVAIRRRAVPVHRALVLSAFAASSLFLAGYLLYHSFSDGPDRYGGPVAWLYYAILISHIILAVTIVPLALVTLRLGWTFHPRHRVVARITFPIWLYVSVTGVLIFAFLHWLDA
jgi:putative membrane protein